MNMYKDEQKRGPYRYVRGGFDNGVSRYIGFINVYVSMRETMQSPSHAHCILHTCIHCTCTEERGRLREKKELRWVRIERTTFRLLDIMPT